MLSCQLGLNHDKCFSIVLLRTARKILVFANRKILLQIDSQTQAELSQMWLLLPRLSIPPRSYKLLQEFAPTAVRAELNTKQLLNDCWWNEITPEQCWFTSPSRAANPSRSQAASPTAHASLSRGQHPPGTGQGGAAEGGNQVHHPALIRLCW